MCGISGIITSQPKTRHLDALKRMNKSLHHRGPDGNGYWCSENQQVLLAHNRLAIIDLSTVAGQPMFSYDKQFVIIFNGEIYNYPELKAACIKKGSIFNSASDTEVIMECYRYWKTDCFLQFRGMWSLVIYDMKKNEVIMSRDPFGIKPLYYGFHHNDLYFGSEPKALRAATDYFNEIDPISKSLFIEHGFLDRREWTFFKHIKCFSHAHYAIISLDEATIKVEPKLYWQPPVDIKNIRYKDAVRELRHLLIDSLALHLRSDVAVGSCLSGGIDSSAIVSIGNKIHGHHFKTFTAHYPSHAAINERFWADQVIDDINADAIYVEPTFEGFMQDFDKVIYHQDEPFGSTSIFAQHAVFKEIGKSGIKVVLDGQGSDEQFSGYIGFLPQFLQNLLDQKKYMLFLFESLALNKNYDYPVKMAEIVKKIMKSISKKQALSRREHFEIVDTLEARLQYYLYKPKTYEEILTQLTCHSNVPQLLRYEDRNSMAYSIEARVPFLDTKLVNFVLSLPAEFKVKNGYTKAILRDALVGILPEELRLRINKLGFPTPEILWMKQGFGLQVDGSGSRAWRELITNRWASLNKRETSCAALPVL